MLSLKYIYIFLAIGVCITLIILMGKHRNRFNAGLIVFTASLGGMAILSLLSSGSVPPFIKVWVSLEYFCMMVAIAGFLILILDYTKRQHYLDIVNLAFLFILPILILILALTDSLHQLFWEPNTDIGSIVYSPRILWRWLISLYIIGLLIVNQVILLRLFLQGSLLYQRQSGILLLGIFVTVLIIVIGLLSNSYFHDLDKYLLGYGLLGLALGHCYYNNRLFDTVPISRSLIIDRNPDGIVVLDTQNRIIDMNPAAEAIINNDRNKVFGQPAESILSNWEMLTQDNDGKMMDFTGTIVVNNELRYYSVWISLLVDHRNQEIGKIITWRDVTERKKFEGSQQRARDEMFVLLQAISGAASESSDWRDFLINALYPIVYSFHSQVGVIYLIEAKNNNSNFHISTLSNHGLTIENMEGLTTFLGSQRIISQIYKDREHIVVSDDTSGAEAFQALQQLGITSLLLVPMTLDQDSIGVICLGRNEQPNYSSTEINRLKIIADEIATLIISERQRQLRIALTERKRLVQDLHDSITQKLYGLIMLTEAARIGMKTGSIKKIPKMIGQIEENARYALKEMRLFLFEVTPQDLKREGLVAVINHRLAAVEGRADVDARLITDGEISISLEKQVALYYIVQEALNNTLRHSSAKVVTVQLSSKRKNVTLEVNDDGMGFKTKDAYVGGMGLTNMRDRASQIGARLKVSSKPGHGTTIKVIVPADKFISQKISGDCK